MAHADGSPPAARHSLAELLRTARARALLTQEELAERAGMSVRAIRNLESGRVVRPRSASVRLLADALGLDGDERVVFRTLIGADREPPGPRGPAQLPADVAGFVGRVADLARLDSPLSGELPGAQRPTTIVAIAGPAGVGKTALAVHWAQREAHRFPDGQLYIDLRGHGSGAPLSPLQALAQMLRSLGIDAERIPVELDEAAGLFRSRLAGQRVLVLLDNARDAEQVRPLLPGTPGCQVMVTSRDRLTGLVATHGAMHLTLGVMAPEEAVALLEEVLGHDGITADVETIGELAQLCAYLPLALRIAAANVAGRPDRSVADHVATLHSGDLLDGLEVAGDPQAAVRVAFDRSYERLDHEAQRLFRLAAWAPGSTVTVRSAAAITATANAQAGRLLTVLAKAHLIEARGDGRYAYHDLLHRYARERAGRDDDAGDRGAAVLRLCSWYLRCIDEAARMLYPRAIRLPVPPLDAGPAPFTDGAGALAWLDDEWLNLTVTITGDVPDRPPSMVWMLADALRGYLWAHRNPVDHRAIAIASLGAATYEGDLAARAVSELHLGDAYQCTGTYPEAVAHYTAGRDLARRAGRPMIEAGNVLNLGNIAGDLGDLDVAIEHQATALRLFRAADEAKGGASALGNLGNLHWERGALDKAAQYQEEALALYRKIENRVGEGNCLDSLGEIALARGEFEVAQRLFTEAVALHREVGDRYGEAYGLGCLAALHTHTGQLALALELATRALDLADEIGDLRTQAETHSTLGTVHLGLGDQEQAVDHHRRALDLARAAGTRYAETTARLGLATARRVAGHHLEAATEAQRALALARTVGYRLLEGQALTTLAEIALAEGDHAEAVGRAEDALAVHRQTGQDLWVARTQAVRAEAIRRS